MESQATRRNKTQEEFVSPSAHKMDFLTGKLDFQGPLLGKVTPGSSLLETVSLFFLAGFVSHHQAQSLSLGLLWK